MHKITVGWMYPNLLNLHGERGSVQALVEIGKHLGIDVEVLRIEDFADTIPFESIDLLMFLPGEISTLKHIIPVLKNTTLGAYLEQGGYALALGTSGLMFGKSILREDGSTISGLGFLDMTAKERKFVFGDDFHFRMKDNDMELAGAQIQMADVDAKDPLGTVIYGMGNNGSGAEGARWNNLVYTNCTGPLFVKNPWFAEQILKEIMASKGVTIEETGSYPIAKAGFAATLAFIDSKPKK